MVVVHTKVPRYQHLPHNYDEMNDGLLFPHNYDEMNDGLLFLYNIVSPSLSKYDALNSCL